MQPPEPLLDAGRSARAGYARPWATHPVVARTWFVTTSLLGIVAIDLTATVASIGVPGATRAEAGPPSVTDHGVAVVLVAIVLAGAFWFRRRWPLVALGAAAVLPLVLQLDGLAVLLVAGSIIGRWESRWRWPAAGAAGAIAAIAVARDIMRGPDGSVIGRLVDDPLHLGLIATIDAILAVLVGALCLGYGLWVRALLRVDDTQATADELQALSARLTTELADVDRRVELSQTMHDTVAKTLTHVALRVDAIRSSRALAPELRGAADELTAQVRRAVAELQDVQRAIEDDGTAGGAPAGPRRGLQDAKALIDETRAAGREVLAEIVVLGRAPLSDSVDACAYWILSEALMNATKHSRGRIEVTVRADDAHGIRILVANPITPGSPGLGGGRGTRIVEERARAVGGSASAGADGAWFVLRAALPWR